MLGGGEAELAAAHLESGVEGDEVQVLVGSQRILVAGVQDHGVQSVARRLPPLGSHGGQLQRRLHVVAWHKRGAVLLQGPPKLKFPSYTLPTRALLLSPSEP